MIFVAELTINHLGMNNIAKAMITEAKNAGANYVKFKFKDVDKYYPDNGKKWRNFNFKEYRGSLELDRDSFQELVDHCNKIGIGFFSTIHDQDSLDFISQFDPAMYKIASMDADKPELFKMVVKKCKEENKPLVYSMGGKRHDFFVDAVERIEEAGVKAFVLHTVSSYPTPAGVSNIDYIKDMILDAEDTKNLFIGYSGHEEGYAASIGAALNGVTMIERHFSLSRDLKIHHIKCSLLPEEFRAMVDIINELEQEVGKNSSFSEGEMSFLKDMNYD